MDPRQSGPDRRQHGDGRGRVVRFLFRPYSPCARLDSRTRHGMVLSFCPGTAPHVAPVLCGELCFPGTCPVGTHYRTERTMVAILIATGQNPAFHGLDEYLPVPLLPLA